MRIAIDESGMYEVSAISANAQQIVAVFNVIEARSMRFQVLI